MVNINKIKVKLERNEFILSRHAEEEKQTDEISYFEIDEAFEDLEIVEDYPDDPRGNSCLVLGFTQDGRPLHFVLGNLEEEKILIITMYRPGVEEWVDSRLRRQQ